jgi:hypothetical protein
MNTIFIFYDNPENVTFLIENNKEYNWQWIGSGGNPNPLYPFEMQFMGPPETELDFKEFLEIQLNKLKQQGKIIRYYLANNFY